VKKRIDGLIAKWVALSERRAGTILLVAFVLGGLALASSMRITVDARIESLLPDGTASEQAIEELRARTSTDSPLYLLVQSSDPELNRRLARRIRDEVAEWPETEWVISERDPTFFLERRLLYLATEDLEELADRVEQIVEYEECELLPGCVNFDERPADPTEEELAAMFERIPEVGALASLFGKASFESEAEAGDPAPAGESEQRMGELCSSDGEICAVQAVLEGDPLNLDYSKQILARTDDLFARLRPADAPADLKLATSGQYRDAPITQRVVIEDLAKTGVVSTILLLVVLVPLFRGWRAFVVLGIPLLLGTAYTFGVLGVVYPRLNLISAFTLAILAGVGVDFGIHLLSHYGAHRDHGLSPREAVQRTIIELFGSMTMAAITTATGFAALAPASFRGFSEMGVISAGGILLAVVTFVLMLPPAILFLHRVLPTDKPIVRPWPFLTRIKSPSPRVNVAITVAGLAIAAAVGYVGYRGIDFEYDFRKLRPASVGHGIAWGRAVHGTNRTAVYLIADRPEDLESVTRRLLEQGPGDLVRTDQPWLITPQSFVPPDQEARLAAITRLRAAVDEAKRRAPPAVVERLDRISPYLDVTEPIRDDDLPAWVRGWFVERDGRFGNLGVMFTDFSGADARQMETLSNQIDEYRHKYPEIKFASAVALLGEIIPSLRSDGPEIFGLAVLGLALAVLLVRRSFVRLVTVLAPLALSAALTMGLLVLFDLRINFYNMLVFPLAVGMGIDGSIYVVEAILDSPRGENEPLWTAARAVLGATMTTIVAFGSLAMASNPGLVSLAEVAIISMGSTLIVNLLWLPPCMWLLRRRLRRES
jgi:uncharacterized protein